MSHENPNTPAHPSQLCYLLLAIPRSLGAGGLVPGWRSQEWLGRAGRGVRTHSGPCDLHQQIFIICFSIYPCSSQPGYEQATHTHVHSPRDRARKGPEPGSDNEAWILGLPVPPPPLSLGFSVCKMGSFN